MLVAGDSAGGVACFNHANWMRQAVAEAAPHLERFSALPDAAWFLDVPSYAPSAAVIDAADTSAAATAALGRRGVLAAVPAAASADRANGTSDGAQRAWPGGPAAVHANVGAGAEPFTFQGCARALQSRFGARFDVTCEAAFPPKDSWRCFHAQYAAPHLAVRTLYHQNLYDWANLGYDGASPKDYEDFRARMEEALEMAGPVNKTKLAGVINESSGLGGGIRREMMEPGAGQGGVSRGAEVSGALRLEVLGYSVFAPACYLHEVLDSGLFMYSHIGEAYFHDVVSFWFWGDDITDAVIVDGHAGMRSSSDCNPKKSPALSE